MKQCRSAQLSDMGNGCKNGPQENVIYRERITSIEIKMTQLADVLHLEEMIVLLVSITVYTISL